MHGNPYLEAPRRPRHARRAFGEPPRAPPGSPKSFPQDPPRLDPGPLISANFARFTRQPCPLCPPFVPAVPCPRSSAAPVVPKDVPLVWCPSPRCARSPTAHAAPPNVPGVPHRCRQMCPLCPTAAAKCAPCAPPLRPGLGWAPVGSREGPGGLGDLWAGGGILGVPGRTLCFWPPAARGPCGTASVDPFHHLIQSSPGPNRTAFQPFGGLGPSGN